MSMQFASDERSYFCQIVLWTSLQKKRPSCDEVHDGMDEDDQEVEGRPLCITAGLLCNKLFWL